MYAHIYKFMVRIGTHVEAIVHCLCRVMDCNTRSKYQSNFYSLYQCQSIFFCLFFQDRMYGHHLVLCLFLVLMLYSLYKQYFNRTTEAKALGNLVAQVHRQCGQTRFVRDTIMKYGINQITITPESLTDGRRD